MCFTFQPVKVGEKSSKQTILMEQCKVLWLIPETWTSSVETKWLIENKVYDGGKKFYLRAEERKREIEREGWGRRRERKTVKKRCGWIKAVAGKTHKHKITRKNESFNFHKVQFFRQPLMLLIKWLLLCHILQLSIWFYSLSPPSLNLFESRKFFEFQKDISLWEKKA